MNQRNACQGDTITPTATLDPPTDLSDSATPFTFTGSFSGSSVVLQWPLTQFTQYTHYKYPRQAKGSAIFSCHRSHLEGFLPPLFPLFGANWATQHQSIGSRVRGWVAARNADHQKNKSDYFQDYTSTKQHIIEKLPAIGFLPSCICTAPRCCHYFYFFCLVRAHMCCTLNKVQDRMVLAKSNKNAGQPSCVLKLQPTFNPWAHHCTTTPVAITFPFPSVKSSPRRYEKATPVKNSTVTVPSTQPAEHPLLRSPSLILITAATHPMRGAYYSALRRPHTPAHHFPFRQ